MSARKIQIGQLWKKRDNGDTFLVTRVYTEALSTFVVLRKSGSEGESLVRVKVERGHRKGRGCRVLCLRWRTIRSRHGQF